MGGGESRVISIAIGFWSVSAASGRQGQLGGTKMPRPGSPVRHAVAMTALTSCFGLDTQALPAIALRRLDRAAGRRSGSRATVTRDAIPRFASPRVSIMSARGSLTDAVRRGQAPTPGGAPVDPVSDAASVIWAAFGRKQPSCGDCPSGDVAAAVPCICCPIYGNRAPLIDEHPHRRRLRRAEAPARTGPPAAWAPKPTPRQRTPSDQVD